MRKLTTVLMVVLLTSLLTVSLLVRAAPPEPIPEQQIQTDTSPTPLSPMMQEIKSALAESEATVLALQAELKAAPDETKALEILRTVSQQKLDTEITILSIQERYARLAGNFETADQIKLAIEKTLNPDPVTPSPEALAERQARGSGGAGHE